MHENRLLQDAIASADTIVHFGAGRCRELSYYRARTDRRIVLVEANPRLAAVLTARTKRMQNVAVLPCAVASASEVTQLRVYSMPSYSSLRKAVGALEYYPGLRQVAEVAVPVRSPVAVLSEIEYSDSSRLCIVVDTPGEELSIIKEMASWRRLSVCTHFIVHCSETYWYEHDGKADEIVSLFDQHNFESVARYPIAPGRSAYLFRHSTRRAEMARLLALREADLNDLQARYADLRCVKERQDEILIKLHANLRTAIDRLHEVADDEDNTSAEARVARTLLEVLTSAVSSGR